VNYAYPTAEIAVMGPDGAVNIIFRKELEGAKDPAAEKARLVAEYREKFANPFKAAELGYVDEVIRPEQTRLKVIRALEMLKDKRQENPPRKHGNIPL
jgi:propionyl-CoA carboxylase beta chain